ncbi:MAG TPA: class A beta-lactamase [Candidatus Cryptobacteroides excrementigallinarum]|nr:class A beta-lactamase [Candidatus Cryptobacteroides excrementigallinarum]
MKSRLFLLLALVLTAAAPASAEGNLKTQLQKIIAGADARVGVAVIADGDTLTVNGSPDYPLMSVMKLHQAVAVARILEERGLPLTTTVHIYVQDLKAGTWSPLRDARPGGGFDMSVAELLRYTLQQSDNNACDILFDRFAAPEHVDSIIRSMGFRDFRIAATEDEMHRDLKKCRENVSSPLSAANLMDRLASGTLPLGKEYADFIRSTLLECRTGLNRLPLPLEGSGALIGHKTGTSDREADGRWTGINDVGFVLLPDGRSYTLAVFISDSALGMEENEKLIADISGAVYSELSGR